MTVEDRLDGYEFETGLDSDEHYLCDWCSKGVSYKGNGLVSHYLCDKLVTGDEYDDLAILGTYCPDCTSRLLYFPCEGYHEVRVLSKLTSDQIIVEPEVTDTSPEDDGIPWDPMDIYLKICSLPKEIAMNHAQDIEMAPENMVTFLETVFYELSVTSMINPDGTVDDTLLKLAQEEFRQFMEEARKGELNFTNHARNQM